jgi:hypothetical protein
MRISKHLGGLHCNAGIAGRCIVCHQTGIDTMVRVATPNSTVTNTMVRAKIEWLRKQDTGDYKRSEEEGQRKKVKRHKIHKGQKGRK